MNRLYFTFLCVHLILFLAANKSHAQTIVITPASTHKPAKQFDEASYNRVRDSVNAVYKAETDELLRRNREEEQKRIQAKKVSDSIAFLKTIEPATVQFKGDFQRFVLEIVKNATTDEQKVKNIFIWVATNITYDWEDFINKNYGDQSAGVVLERKLGVCAGYANLFHEMCSVAGFESEVISGYAKGYSYKDGVFSDDMLHAWNAVKINGIWKLFDVTWASPNNSNRRTYEIPEAYKRINFKYFSADPAFLLNTHLPKEGKWQLTGTRHLSLYTFLNTPVKRDNNLKNIENGGWGSSWDWQ